MGTDAGWAEELAARLSPELRGEVKVGEALGAHTTWGVGGPAAIYFTVNDTSELDLVMRAVREAHRPLFVLGCGSNLLVSDDGYDGAVVRLTGSFADFSIGDDGLICAGSAVTLPRLSRAVQQAGFSGIEFCCNIPGTLGGGLMMNAGAHGSSLADVVTQVSWIEFAESVPFIREELPVFTYRGSSLPKEAVVTGARLLLAERDPTYIQRVMDELRKERNQRQPKGKSAGSVFKNPQGESAGRLIEAAGAKGLSRGGAVVSELHANFIINTGRCRASDILALMKEVRRRVFETSGILLEPEVKLVGFSETL